MTRLPGSNRSELAEVIHFLRHSDGRATVVPIHAGETIGPGLLSRILRDCEIGREELLDALR